MTEKMKMHSLNLVQENIARIRELFPSCVTEAQDEKGEVRIAVDFDRLRQELSEFVVEGPQERYQLNWPGKREALLTANTPIAKTLRPCLEESVDFESTQNLFIEGDNLDVLKLLQETYLGKVKMIYIDPPYNTGKDFIYRDDWRQEKAIYERSTGSLNESGERLIANSESRGRFHSDWLGMMYPRLRLARNLLDSDGVIFISIDDNELANLRKMCDEIFGAGNFRNTFILRRYDKNINRQFMDEGLSSFNTGFEYVVCYAKSADFRFSPIFREANEDRKLSGYWKGFWNDADRPTMRYELLGVTPETGQWKWSQKISDEAVTNYVEYERNYSQYTLEEYWEKTNKKLKFIRRNYAGKGKNKGVEHWIPPLDGVLRNTNWLDIFASKATDSIKGGVFDFPKNPIALKIMMESLFPDDALIIDFFAGSGSTAEAVFLLNSEDGGNRRFILVQIDEKTDESSEAFKAGFKNVVDICKERIRKAGNNILKGECCGGWDRDVGFRVLKIDSSNMKDVYYIPDTLKQKNLLEATSNIKEDRKDEDLLFQVLLNCGIDLTLPIRQEAILGKTVFFVEDDLLIACFDDAVTEDFVKKLAEFKPRQVIFRDSGFASDSVKINVGQIFKQVSPSTEVRSI